MGFIQLPNSITPILILSDVIEGLKIIPDESISCIVTSPPYWSHRDYHVSGQIGQERTPGEYIEKLTKVSKELLRAMKKKIAYFLNISDMYTNMGYR